MPGCSGWCSWPAPSRHATALAYPRSRQDLGLYRISAVRAARPAQSSRGPGLARRSTAASCRTTSCSASWTRLSDGAGPASHRTGRASGRAGEQTPPVIHVLPLVSGVSPQLTGEADFWHPTRSAGNQSVADSPALANWPAGKALDWPAGNDAAPCGPGSRSRSELRT